MGRLVHENKVLKLPKTNPLSEAAVSGTTIIPVLPGKVTRSAHQVEQVGGIESNADRRVDHMS
jgi:hypothetical protein